MTNLFDAFSGLHRTPKTPRPADRPLIVAVHGGTYTSAYFDIEGYSLLDSAAAQGLHIVAPDRNGYGQTPMLPPDERAILGQARSLRHWIRQSWRHFDAECSGIVLIGHSIGGAIAARIASEPEDLPLLGLAVSGVGLRTPAEHRPMWNALPDIPHADIPSAMKDGVMFGPAGSYHSAMPEASHRADAPAPRAELVDIVSTWHDDVHSILGKISVPVHYRQGEFDHLWIVDQSEVSGFASALKTSPSVDAALVKGAGHCLDFHRVGAGFHLQQIGFALQCAAQTPESSGK